MNRCTFFFLLLSAGFALTPIQGWSQDGSVSTISPTTEMSSQPWQAIFADKFLDSLVNITVSNNNNAQNAILRIDQARAQLRIRQSRYYPTINLTGSYTLEKTSAGIQHIDQRDNIGEAMASASWEIDVFGNIRKGAKSQKEYYLASREEYRGVIISLISELTANYINLRTYQALLQIAKQNLDSQETLLNLTKAKYTAGLTSALDTAQAKSLWLQTKAHIPVLETNITEQINSIVTLTGEWNDTLRLALTRPAPLPSGNNSPVILLPGDLVRQRPDVMAAERTVDALAAAAGATKADWWPKFYVNGSFGYGSKDFSHFTDQENMSWQIVPSIQWTIFSGRQMVQTTRNATLQLDEGINTYNNTLLTAIGEIESAIYAYNRSLIEMAAQQEAFGQAEITFRLATQLYEKGLNSYQSVLDSQKNMLSFANSLITSQSSVLIGWIQLYKALGGTTSAN